MKASFLAVAGFLLLISECSLADENNGAGWACEHRKLFSGSSSTIVLSSFSLRFTDDQHRNVKLISVRPDVKCQLFRGCETWMKTCLHDESKNDAIAFTVRYKKTDVRKGYLAGSCQNRRFCRKTARFPGWSDGKIFVLRGFELQYSHNGRPIEEVGIVERHGNVRIYLNDIYDNARIRYRVWYSYVRSRHFSQTNLKAKGWAQGYGTAGAPGGVKALQGFWLKLNTGRPLVELGVNDHQSQGNLFYARIRDDNSDDWFQYNVTYAIWN